MLSASTAIPCNSPLTRSSQLNEAELEVDSEKASYKQKLEVLQQQQELIEDEAEQEQKEEDARRAAREAAELEAKTAEALLPDSEVRFSRNTWQWLFFSICFSSTPNSPKSMMPV